MFIANTITAVVNGNEMYNITELRLPEMAAADDGEVRYSTIETPGKQNARKTGYPVFHMLFVKTILMW